MRYEVQKRLAAFYLVSVFVGGFSNILAYGLMQMEGVSGLRGWQWIFVSNSFHELQQNHCSSLTCFQIIEGLLTQIVAIGAWFLIIDFPDKAHKKKFLTGGEAAFVKQRIHIDRGDADPDPLTWTKFFFHLRDWKLWVL